MTIKVAIETRHELINRHAREGWQCPECYGERVIPQQADRFNCHECGAQWDRYQILGFEQEDV